MFAKNKNSKQKGFTLMELLVVIAIIGILSSVVLVNLNTSREKAKIAKAKSEVKTIYQALLRYRIDNDNYNSASIPFESCTGANNICNLANWNQGWLSPYISQSITNDPWGTYYFWDGRPESTFECAQWGSSVCSAGPNKSFQSWNVAGPIGDDICIYFEAEC